MTRCIWDDCDHDAIYCDGHAREAYARSAPAVQDAPPPRYAPRPVGAGDGNTFVGERPAVADAPPSDMALDALLRWIRSESGDIDRETMRRAADAIDRLRVAREW